MPYLRFGTTGSLGLGRWCGSGPSERELGVSGIAVAVLRSMRDEKEGSGGTASLATDCSAWWFCPAQQMRVLPGSSRPDSPNMLGFSCPLPHKTTKSNVHFHLKQYYMLARFNIPSTIASLFKFRLIVLHLIMHRAQAAHIDWLR